MKTNMAQYLPLESSSKENDCPMIFCETVIGEKKITRPVQFEFNQPRGAGKSDNMMITAVKKMFRIWACCLKSEGHGIQPPT